MYQVNMISYWGQKEYIKKQTKEMFETKSLVLQII